MNKVFSVLLTLVISAITFAVPASAATSAVTLQEVPSSMIYPNHFDQLVLAVNVDYTAHHKILNDITIRNAMGSGQLQGVENVRAYYRAGNWGANSFYGWGMHETLGFGNYRYGDTSWSWTGLNLSVPANGLTLYFAVQTSSGVTSNAPLQFQLPAAGLVFADSSLPEQALTNTAQQTLYQTSVDVFGPQIVITKPVFPGIFQQGTDVVVTGQSRDQGGSVVTGLDLAYICDSCEGRKTFESFQNWQTISGDLSNWSITLSDLPVNEPYWVKVRGRDSFGNVGYSNVTAFAVVTSTDDQATEDLTDDNQTENQNDDSKNAAIRDGRLIKAVGDGKVYVVSDGKKHWIPTEKLFLGLGYKWENVFDVDVASLLVTPDGPDVKIDYRHLDGSLVKYQTYPATFLLVNGQRRWIVDEATFIGRGYRWSDIITIPDTEYYPDGENITL